MKDLIRLLVVVLHVHCEPSCMKSMVDTGACSSTVHAHRMHLCVLVGVATWLACSVQCVSMLCMR